MNGNVNITVYNNKSTQEAAERAELAASKVQDVTILNLRNEIPSPLGNILPNQRPNGTALLEGDIMEVNKGIYTNLDQTSLAVSKDKGKLYFDGQVWIKSLEWDFGIPDVLNALNSESNTAALSASMGKVLNEKIAAIPIIEIINGFNSDNQLAASSANTARVLDIIKINKNEKGVPFGLATLDQNGKIPANQIGLSSNVYKGLWDAELNSPFLVNNTGANGDYYLISKSGTQNLGEGSFNYLKMGYIIYSEGKWEYSEPMPKSAPAEFEDFFGV